MIKIVALNDPQTHEPHQEDETVTQVTKEAQVKKSYLCYESSYSTSFFRKLSQFPST